MALHHDLLEQAFHLATRERKNPKQASLRRAVLAAYYALFHLLVAEASSPLSPTRPAGLETLIGRAFDHGHMRHVCSGLVKWNAAGGGDQHIPRATQVLLDHPFDHGLAAVLRTFVDLQEARHQADYDLTTTWNRPIALNHAQAVRDAFSAWKATRQTPNASVVLTALLLQRHWRR